MRLEASGGWYTKYVMKPNSKDSEYPFKQNKNILKNMKGLLYTYFYKIFSNALRPIFFNIYNLPFLRILNIGKIRIKVGP